MKSPHSTSADIHPSRKGNFNDTHAGRGGHPKRSRPEPFVAETHRDGGLPQSFRPKSVSSLRNNIRDLNRLLQHPRSQDMPPGVRIEKERALAGYQGDLEQAGEKKKKDQMIKKYHMVRFFERQKATRAYKRLTKALDMLPSSAPAKETETARKAVHEAEIDLNYTMYYPLSEKYQSLYPRIAEQGPVDTPTEIGGRGERKVGGERPPLWRLIEETTAQGDEALIVLRDSPMQSTPSEIGKLDVGMEHLGVHGKDEMKEKIKDEKRSGDGGGVKLTGGVVKEDDDHEDQSDDGFFEKST